MCPTRLSFVIRAVVGSMCVLVASLFMADGVRGQTDSPSPMKIVKDLNLSNAYCVLVGASAARDALAVARDTDCVVFVQLGPGDDLRKMREQAADAELYGTQLFIEQGALDDLPLADNVADLVICLDETTPAIRDEAIRVAHPGGSVVFHDDRLVKPLPKGVDDWSHPYHGPDNNPQSSDQLARAPYITQFLAEPMYGPLPQTAVAAGGRIFKAFGHIAFKDREEPWLNTLAAFDGYNGRLLWRRAIPEALMVHRNTLIATDTTVYFGDDRSCKVIDAATGELRGEIAPPADQVGGTFWKWMALDSGVLYALIGGPEPRDPVVRMHRQAHGWPWDPLSPGFNRPDYAWGFGRTLVAIDPATHDLLWTYREEQPMDGRAVCMNGTRIFAFRLESYLTCLDAKTGRVVWRKTPDDSQELFAALGRPLNRQDWRTNWRTSAYLKCSDQALYFAGPELARLVAVSAEDGSLLWQDPYSNYQLVLRDDALYGISGQMGQEVGMTRQMDRQLSQQTFASRKFDPLTGEILAEIPLGRRACTRPNGSIDGILCRARGGSVRLDITSLRPQLISPMRAQCQDGITVANGHLYWWPSTCDCNLNIYGLTGLAPAGDRDLCRAADERERLQVLGAAQRLSLETTAGDWPMFRADPKGSVRSPSLITDSAKERWQVRLPEGVRPTAPVAAGALTFIAADDGIVRAFDGATGKRQWRSFTGGGMKFPPAVAQGRLIAGSGDGWVYAFAADTGQPLWRFRAAPYDRRIPVYGRLFSTWPAASGVLASDDTAYVAAGILNYDGTHVYALDVATGRLKWQNNSVGHLDPEARTGVSVQGHLLLNRDRLFLAGGNVLSPAIFDAETGQILNDTSKYLRQTQNNMVPATLAPRGSELYLIGESVLVSGKPLYAHPVFPVYDFSVDRNLLVVPGDQHDLLWLNRTRLAAVPHQENASVYLQNWGKPAVPGLTPVWQKDVSGSSALAVGKNAVVVARTDEIAAFDLETGRLLWRHDLPAPAVSWGLAIDRKGRIIVSLTNGMILCFG